ncbi:hypothetical protein AMTR_s00115p00112570 [Amborella trichopoda]|uniref:Uncharacterized protein n=1 Tax=Amborella trichopoda TaxID=13333 RepID=W1NSM7_AMBTC|nr:hypothetical protein AMTR_s00115p00112570 [Amborella trichopoda]
MARLFAVAKQKLERQAKSCQSQQTTAQKQEVRGHVSTTIFLRVCASVQQTTARKQEARALKRH